MLLSDKSIRDQQRQHNIINPYRDDHVQPGSYEVTLNWAYKKRTNECEDCASGACYSGFHCEHYWWQDRSWYGEYNQGYDVLQPNDFVLATTNESVRLPDNITARVEGKSSLGRVGLLIHVTAGFIDAGFMGQITLELKNLSPEPLALRPGQKIGQLAFFAMTTPAEFPYGHAALNSNYQGQQGPTVSALENS